MRLPTFSRCTPEDARAGGVEGEVHRGFLGLVVDPAARGEPVAGEHHLFLDQQAPGHRARRKTRRRRAPGRPAPRERGHAHVVVIEPMRISRGRRAPEDLLRLGRVLHARQLHHDAVRALLLITGSATPSSCDAVVQRLDVFCFRANS